MLPTVSADPNSMALINKSDKCDLVEWAFVVPWQLLIYVPAVTDSILIFYGQQQVVAMVTSSLGDIPIAFVPKKNPAGLETL